ncbi:MAG TPA: hypothetical protein VEW94_14970 [Chloroflexia bacterium]|nr:hypothetical protein [Chloroflexia bacterium]
MAYDKAKLDKFHVELRDLYKQTFGKYANPPAPAVGRIVQLDVVPDNKLGDVIGAEAQRLPDFLLKWLLNLAPDKVNELLMPKYRRLGETYPYTEVSAKTQLKREDAAIIKSQILQGVIQQWLQNPAQILGFYSQTTGKIFLKESGVDKPGPLAHELVHAYANQTWHQFTFLMRMRKMMNVSEVNEGLAIHVADIVCKSWSSRHNNADAGDTGSGYGPQYLQTAQEFVKELSNDIALEALFGGFITSSGKNYNDKPEDSLTFGRRKKAWKWKWR